MAGTEISNRLYNVAKLLVDCKLEAGDFVDSNISYIYKRLVRCDAHVTELQGSKGNQIFLAQCRDVLESVVHLGASLKNYRRAREYVRKVFGVNRGDPGLLLIILILVYIVKRIKGYRDLLPLTQEHRKSMERQFKKSLLTECPGEVATPADVNKDRAEDSAFERIQRGLAEAEDTVEIEKSANGKKESLDAIWRRIYERTQKLSKDVPRLRDDDPSVEND